MYFSAGVLEEHVMGISTRVLWRLTPPSLAPPSGHLHPCPRHLYNSRNHYDDLELHKLPHTLSTMDRLSRLLSCVLLLLLPIAAALKFDLHPVSPHDAAKYERCVRNFVAKDQLVVVTAILDGYRGDGQKVDMHVRSS
jgi:hypothetical protein